MLKKSLSILLLCAILFNLTGVYVVFKIEQLRIKKSIKKQIKAGIPQYKLHYFSFSQLAYENLNWEKADKEFQLGNNMFDVVNKFYRNDSVFLYCINDDEETVLFAQLDELIKRKLEQESNAPQNPIRKVAKLFKLLYFSDKTTNQTVLNTEQFKARFLLQENVYASPILDYFIPPPNFA